MSDITLCGKYISAIHLLVFNVPNVAEIIGDSYQQEAEETGYGTAKNIRSSAENEDHLTACKK